MTISYVAVKILFVTARLGVCKFSSVGIGTGNVIEISFVKSKDFKCKASLYREARLETAIFNSEEFK